MRIITQYIPRVGFLSTTSPVTPTLGARTESARGNPQIGPGQYSRPCLQPLPRVDLSCLSPRGKLAGASSERVSLTCCHVSSPDAGVWPLDTYIDIGLDNIAVASDPDRGQM